MAFSSDREYPVISESSMIHFPCSPSTASLPSKLAKLSLNHDSAI